MARGFLVLGAAFWTWFFIADGISDGGAVLATNVALTAILWASCWLVFAYPRIGGPVLVALGFAALWFFENTFTDLVLGAPLVLIGAIVVATARQRIEVATT